MGRRRPRSGSGSRRLNPALRLTFGNYFGAAVGTARSRTTEHHEHFAQSLENSGANETQIRGRLAAARSEGTHPSAALTKGKGAAKARKRPFRSSCGTERGKNGLSR